MNTELDIASLEEQRDTTWSILQDHLHYLAENSPYYREAFAKNGIDVSELTSIEEIQNLPVTTKADLANHNERFIAVEDGQIAEFVTTSGSTGSPVTIALTQGDLNRLSYNEARSLTIAGIQPGDRVQISTTLDKQFMAGMAYYSGLITLGATVVRSGPGSAHFQNETIKRHRANVLIGVGSFLSNMISELHENGIRKMVCIGEPLRHSDFTPNAIGKKLDATSEIAWFSTYASTEIATAFTECEAGMGGHVLPELVHVEILDENDLPVPNGELGEVTLTPLGIEGTPVLRYKTGDLARLHSDPCSCGRKTPRLGPIEGRKSQMIKLKGTTIYPPQIENSLHHLHISEYVIRISAETKGSDQVTVFLNASLEKDHESIAKALRDELRVGPELIFCESNELKKMLFPQENRKPLKVQDLRDA